MFNAYGDTLLSFARTLATYMGMYYKEVVLTNNGSMIGNIYINKGRGVVIGNQDVVASLETYDLKYVDEGCCCYNCEEVFDPEEMLTGNDQENYCEECFNDLFLRCIRCGDVYERESSSMHRACTASGHLREQENPYCTDCIEELRRRGNLLSVDGIAENVEQESEADFA